MDKDARKICNGIKGGVKLFSVGNDLSVYLLALKIFPLQNCTRERNGNEKEIAQMNSVTLKKVLWSLSVRN